jgi:Protein of unknown function (DUF1553)/Protein of unknown function (DUF1549)
MVRQLILLVLCLLSTSALAGAAVDTAWWAFQPLKGAAASLDSAPRSIDSFIRLKLEEKGLTLAPKADSSTLLRRLYFDLIGLPPSPEEIAQSANVPYEKWVDDLLASPRYGERWARHWLDVVHYGETHGYDKDKPRLNAWPYRDYVIRAFNGDKPYARFIEEQIAGDVLYPDTTDGLTALGFLAAGPWDFIGHAEVPESKLDGKVARHLDRDDMVQNALGTLCSLTVHCAQCHDHKFDPITQADYYALQAVFAAIDRTDIDYYPEDAEMKRTADLQKSRKRFTEALAAAEAPLIKKAGEALNSLDQRIEHASKSEAPLNPGLEFGYHSALSPVQDAVKWVQVDLGRCAEISRIVLKPCYDDFAQIGRGFGFPVRFKIEVSDDPTFKEGVSLLGPKYEATFQHDCPNPGLHPFEATTAGHAGVTGRYVRVTAVKLAPRQHDFIFALAELEAYESPAGPNIAGGAGVTALDSIEAPPRWRRMNLTDRIAPEGHSAEEKAQLILQRNALILNQTDETGRISLRALRDALAALPSLPAPHKIYAGAIHTGTGSFEGTGARGGQPRVIHVLKRGDVKQPGPEMGPGGVQALSRSLGLSFHVIGEAESARRAALAHWITDKNNALTWRSIVNRVWQHHFGRGLVETPNDFGHMGAQPSHPELLDWLTLWFRDQAGGSIKALHRLIVMSETYRTISGTTEPSDANNVLLSHQNRRKLDAESLRDSLLAVSGTLDLTMGGPSFQDFVIDKPEHSPHYEYQRHDPEDPKSHRRSIYRFIVRSQPQPFMTVMDCADPSMRVDKRNESLSPLQALALMNNGLTVTMAKHFAARVRREAEGIEAQARRAFSLALSRDPQPEELAPLAIYAREEGLENMCRLILNLNEFCFID